MAVTGVFRWCRLRSAQNAAQRCSMRQCCVCHGGDIAHLTIVVVVVVVGFMFIFRDGITLVVVVDWNLCRGGGIGQPLSTIDTDRSFSLSNDGLIRWQRPIIGDWLFPLTSSGPVEFINSFWWYVLSISLYLQRSIKSVIHPSKMPADTLGKAACCTDVVLRSRAVYRRLHIATNCSDWTQSYDHA